MLQGQRQACRHTNHADMLQRWWKSAVTQQPGPSNKPQTILRPGLEEKKKKMPHDKTIKNKTNWNVFCWAWLRSCSNDYLDTLITRQYIVPLKNIVWIQVTKPWRPLLWLVFPSILGELWMIAYKKAPNTITATTIDTQTGLLTRSLPPWMRLGPLIWPLTSLVIFYSRQRRGAVWAGWVRLKGERGTIDGLTMTLGLIVFSHYRATLV